MTKRILQLQKYRKSARGERKGQVGQHFLETQRESTADTMEYSKKHPRMRNDIMAGKQLSRDHVTGLTPYFHPTVHFSGKNALDQASPTDTH